MKGTELSQHARNILAVYYRANSLDMATGLNWYKSAYELCLQIKARYSHKVINLEKIAGVIAALSPRMKWSTNVEKAEQVIGGFYSGLTQAECGKGIMRANLDKAWRILEGEKPLEVLGGFKVRSFYECILEYRTNAVCIDTHAISIALGKRANEKITQKYFKSLNLYGDLVAAYREAANELAIGLEPRQLQAITWVTWRRLELGQVDN